MSDTPSHPNQIIELHSPRLLKAPDTAPKSLAAKNAEGEMSEEITRRRITSPHVAAMRNERKLLFGVRRQIEGLQKRVAFVEARARSTRPIGIEEIASEAGEIRKAARAALQEIAALMGGADGVGPAQDCRKALAQIEERLKALPTNDISIKR